MKKTLIAILLAMTMVFILPACGSSSGSSGSDPSEDPELDEVTTIDNVMDSLTEDGEYSKTDDGYVWESDEDGVKTKYTFTVNGNEVNMEGILDYGEENAEMIQEFKDDPESIETIPADFLMEFASLANAEDSVMNYIIYVGDQKVAEGRMTYDEADAIASEIDD